MQPHAADASTWQVVAAVTVFLLTYGIIITEKINRALIALAGALVMIVLGLVHVQDAYSRYIQWETVFLLIGMMILVGITGKTGVFQYAAVKAAQRAKGDPLRILILLALLTAAGSALFDNVTTVLLMVPITFSITRLLQIHPVPFLIAEILASNIGGTATLIGNPPNIMIGTATHLDFNAFLLHLAPVAVIIMGVVLLYLKRVYGKRLQVTEENKAKLMNLNAADSITDRKRMIKSLAVLGLTFLGFLLHNVIHTDEAVVAMAGATLLLLIGFKEHDLEEVFHSVEWVTVIFLAGLFVLVGGLMEAGVTGSLARSVLAMTGGDIAFASMLVLWVSGLVSATVDHIPFVAAMIPVVKEMSVQLNAGDTALNPVWWSLALGACLGGNGTLLGSTANLIVAGMSQREGQPVTFMEFLKAGIPVTFISLVIAAIYVRIIIL